MANNKPRNTERDAAMIADFEAGMNKTQIAAKNGVSRQRASKIINMHQSREMTVWRAVNDDLLDRLERNELAEYRQEQQAVADGERPNVSALYDSIYTLSQTKDAQ
jgi:transposase